MNMSGRSHGDVTWFTDIVGQVGTEPRLRVVWQDWRDGERWAGYLKRAQDCTFLGLVLGRRPLGLRVKDDDPRWQQRPCSWRVDGLPREVDHSEVVDILKDLGFQAIDVHGHNPRGRTKVWFAKAMRSDDLDVVQTELQMDGLRPVQLTVTKEAKTFKGLPAWPLKPERRVSCLRDEGPTAHVPDADLPLETQESMDLDRDAPGDVPAAEGDAKGDPVAEAKQAGKRAPEPQVRGKAKRQASAPWEHGGQVVPNDGGGDCLWKAIAQGLTKQEPSKPRTHRQLRAFVGSYMQTNCSTWDALWQGQGSLNSKGQEKLPSFQAYLDEQLLQGSWSGALEILAVCTARKCRVWVVTKDGKLKGKGNLWFFCMAATTTSSCSTCRRRSSGDATLSSLKPASSPRRRPLYGGGKGSSLRLTDFASTSSARAKNKRAVATDEPKSLRLTDFASVGKEPSRAELRMLRSQPCTSKTRPRASSVAVAPSEGALDDVDDLAPDTPARGYCSKYAFNGGFRFACDLCPHVAEYDTSLQARGGKTRHMRRFHPEVRKQGGIPRQPQPSMVPEADGSLWRGFAPAATKDGPR